MTSGTRENTRVVYVSSMVSPPAFAALFSDAPHPPSQATQKYDVMLAQGFVAAGAEVIALCAPPVSHQTSARRFVHLPRETDAGVQYRYLPVIDFPFVKHAVTWLCAFFQTLSLTDSRTRVLCYGLNVTAARGAWAAAKLLHRPASVIVSDVPEQLGNGMLMRIAQRSLAKYDGYVLLTEAMNGIINPRGMPYTVLEGQVDAAMATRENPLSGKCAERTVLYAGMLHAKYGVLRLVTAFSSLPDPDLRLVLYGTGDAEAAIRLAAQRDSRIEYRGVADNGTVVAEEIRATLLVNPRPSDELYTRYSFPSKNLEYMVSGTPVLTTNLPGMPEEYRAHVYLFEDESPEGMAKTLSHVLSLPRAALHETGACAKAFVLANKSNAAQARRMLAFMEELA